jgi:cell fate (sporulation/competence/biofilm development) regulator YlbF (YheA/YmcA/DUF963 family)
VQDILDAAAGLGRRIAGHESYRRLRAAEAKVGEQPDTRKLIEDFEAQRRKIAELEEAVKPVEVADKHELQRLADAVHANADLQELLRAQADYLAMMNRINRAIRQELDGETPDGQA